MDIISSSAAKQRGSNASFMDMDDSDEYLGTGLSGLGHALSMTMGGSPGSASSLPVEGSGRVPSMGFSSDADSDTSEQELRLVKPYSAGQPASVLGVLASCNAALLPPGTSILDHALQLIHDQDLEDTFFIIDLGMLRRLHSFFVAAMPRVTPFYAMKCMPEKGMMAMLAALGAGFDCASPAEIDAVLALGVPPERIIYAHPVKSPAQIRYAAGRGVRLTTFDTPGELAKLAAAAPEMQTLLRIRADDASALCSLGSKYGAEPDLAPGLLAAAAALHVPVVGVSFHVGSASQDPKAFQTAIRFARRVFDQSAALGFKMRILDLGGGLTAQVEDGAVVGLGGVPAVVNAALAVCFPPEEGVTIIAEPGRYFAEATATLMCCVTGTRERMTPPGSRTTDYWLTDGIYGSFNGILYDHLVPRPVPLPRAGFPAAAAPTVPTRASSLFGPTCDGADVICRDVQLPDLAVGDYLAFPSLGAYSWAGACNFNGFETVYVRFFYAVTA